MSTRLVRSTALWLIAILICLPAITGTAPAVAAAGTGADPDGHLEAAARVAHHGMSNGHSGADGAASGSDSSICDERPCPFCRDIADASDDFDRPE
ncbi:MAG TPA: hypothetical protein VM491_18475, partial [Burkholderiaceae bacterium]|nr:hypothetical protein [Burkholderiaceae bacterium]